MCFLGPALCCSLKASVYFPFLACCPGCWMHCFGWLSAQSLWSVFPVLYLMAWKQLKKHRCFFVGWAGRCSVYRSNLLLGFSPFSVALKISSIETAEYERFFLQVVNRVRKLICASCFSMSLEVPLSAYLHASSVRKKKVLIPSLFLRTLVSGF